MKKTILIHHHIFKNAGTSFNFALKKSFGNQFFEFDLPNSSVVTEEHLKEFISAHPQALAISSHHAAMPTPQTEFYNTISSVILRKPLARIKSIYQFERKQQAQTEGAIKAKELNFKEFVLWRLETSPIVFCNYQTHYCSRSGNMRGKRKLTEEELKIAMNNLRNCCVVGTVERYDESLKLAENKLREFYPDIKLNYSTLNTTSQVGRTYADIKAELMEDLGQELVTKIEQMNQLDEQLYEFGDRLIDYN